MRFSSSQVFWPNSDAQSRARSSNARPCTLRWPRCSRRRRPGPGRRVPGRRPQVRRQPQDLAAERVRILRDATGRRRRRCPRRAVPSGPNTIRPPLWMPAFGMPVKPTCWSRSAPSTQFHRGDPVVLGRGVVHVQPVVGGEVGETATPSSPPSPPGATPSIVPTSVTVPSLSTRLTVAASRPVTTPRPSGRKSSPQGVSRPVATVLTDSVAGWAVVGLGAGHRRGRRAQRR